MSEGELRIKPFALIGGISLVLTLLLLPVISLRISQIFLGFLANWVNFES
jgi:hypothetical protein